MEYTANNVNQKRDEYINWLNNLATDLASRSEDASVKDLFPGSDIGDVATAKDLVGNFLALLTGENINIA